MCPSTDNPASCEIRAVIRFLHAKNMSVTEIHCKLCAAVYGRNVISEGTLRQLYRMFTKSEVVSRPSAVSDCLVQSADQTIYGRRRFTISELSREFP
jgi:hypothetical protein